MLDFAATSGAVASPLASMASSLAFIFSADWSAGTVLLPWRATVEGGLEATPFLRFATSVRNFPSLASLSAEAAVPAKRPGFCFTVLRSRSRTPAVKPNKASSFGWTGLRGFVDNVLHVHEAIAETVR